MGKQKKETTVLESTTCKGNLTSLTGKVEQLYPIGFYSPVKMGKAFRDVRTIEGALRYKTDCLSTLRRVEGVERVEALIVLWLVHLNKFLELKNPMTEEQLDEVASEIVSEFSLLTMLDVHVVFKRAKMGLEGEFYERISPPKVMVWFRKYAVAKAVAVEASNDREAERYKNSYIGDRTGGGDFMKLGKIMPSVSIK